MSGVIDSVLVETTPRAMRIALLAGRDLVELHVDRAGRGHREGDVFAARVTRVVPGLDAAFVDLGDGVAGFLPAREAALAGAARETISRLVHEGERVTVKILKEALDDKCPKVSRRVDDADGTLAAAAARVEPPRLIARREALILRLLDRIGEARLVLDSAAELARLRKRIDPARLTLHQGKTPLFDMAEVDRQIDEALDPVVPLASGARLVFEPVRTLTAVDVDVAAAAERSADPLAVNLEAAPVVARHIRLRNLAGLVVVDFLNMTGDDAGRRLAETLRQAMANDPAEVALVGPSRFGLVEMARERRGRPLADDLGSPVERAADALVRRLSRTATAGAGSLDIRASPAVVAELCRAADGKDIANWIGRGLDIAAEAARADGDFVVHAR